ncbi:MAG: TonB-dependent receptor [Phycisphaerales bacterium]|nr:TonB-dependent receptor [Phycisphaerales bacterium]
MKFLYQLLKRASLTALLFFTVIEAVSAQDKPLKEVRIHSQKADKNRIAGEKLHSFASGMKILSIDSQYLKQYAYQNLSQLLSQQVPVFVKAYGINSMATLNFRGSSSAQSQVLWNGVPLNNASSGITDISMLSVQHFDQIHIVYGGSAALLGSGNIGAALILDNRFETTDSTQLWITKLGLEAGSFGQQKVSFQEQFATRKLLISLKLMQQSAQNNFEYIGQNGLKQSMGNAHFQSQSGMFNLGYKISRKTSLQFSTWYQHYYREIPPALFERVSVKNQEDASLRFLLTVVHKTTIGANWYSKTAFMNDAMRYQDSSISLVSNNQIHQLYQEFGYKKSFGGRHEFLLCTPITIAWTKPTNDIVVRYQNKIALAAAYQYRLFQNKLELALNARVEKINEQKIFLLGFNAAYSMVSKLKLRLNVQRTYRAPTLNEWYYQPGGNIDLKPEQGWSGDLGYELKLPIHSNLLFSHDVSMFARSIKDWILWFGGSIWTPHNIAQVYSRGLESFNTLVWQQGNWKANIGLNTSFVLATTQQSDIPNDGSIGKQIPYSPRYNGQVNIGFGFKKLICNYNHTYIGYRFITIDESQYLSPYNVGNFYASYSKRMLSADFKFSFQCNNLWNKTYEIISSRAMPMRNFAFALTCTF